jgi:hypothetical protein
MAKALIFLLGVLVVLNGMTFLVVVNQAPPVTSGADAAGKPKGSDPNEKRLERIEELVNGLSRTVSNLSQKVDGLPSKVSQTVSRMPAPAAAVQADPSSTPTKANRGRINPSRVRSGPVDYSRHTEAQGAPAQPSREEMTDDESTPAAAPAPPAETAAPEASTPAPSDAGTPDPVTPDPNAQPAAGTEGQEPPAETPAEGTVPAGPPAQE